MKRSFVIHPFLLAIFPILFILSYNIAIVQLLPIKVVIIPIVIIICYALLSWSLLSFIFKNKKKAGLVVSLSLLLFFSYGHIRDLIVYLQPRQFIQGHVGLFVAIPSALLLITGAFLVIISRSNFSSFTKFLNITAITMVTICHLKLILIEPFVKRGGLVTLHDIVFEPDVLRAIEIYIKDRNDLELYKYFHNSGLAVIFKK